MVFIESLDQEGRGVAREAENAVAVDDLDLQRLDGSIAAHRLALGRIRAADAPPIGQGISRLAAKARYAQLVDVRRDLDQICPVLDKCDPAFVSRFD